MPDNDSPQGSWQPDPTGRFKLRWQRSSGEWTHHVHDHDGNPNTDLYTPEPEKPRKKRRIWRRVLIAWAIVMALIVVMAVIGALIEPDSDPAATAPATTRPAAAGASPEPVTATRSATTTPAKTTTARRATTTTVRRTTTTAPAATDAECNARASAFAILLPEVIDWFDTLAWQASIGDLYGMQETYDLLKWAMTDLPDMSRDLLGDCGHHLTESERRDARDSLRQAESGWRDIQAVCRSDLAALGFDC